MAQSGLWREKKRRASPINSAHASADVWESACHPLSLTFSPPPGPPAVAGHGAQDCCRCSCSHTQCDVVFARTCPRSSRGRVPRVYVNGYELGCLTTAPLVLSPTPSPPPPPTAPFH